MTPDQLDSIIAAAPEKLREIMGELHPRILEAAGAALTAHQDDEDGGKPKVAISLKVSIALNHSTPVWYAEGGVSVKYKACSEMEQLDETPEFAPGFGKQKKGGVE